jgi:hypothetical protein
VKILGTTPGGFLIEATRTEVANLAGLYSEYDLSKNNIEVGSTLDAHALFSHRYDMHNQRTELGKAAERLRAAADLIDTAMPRINPPVLEE